MASNDIPPPHVPAHLVRTCGLLQISCSLWTICYVLMLYQSRKTHNCGMPLFALCLNVSWELSYSVFIVETTLEFLVFSIWLLIDCGLMYEMLKRGKKEWTHAPFVQMNLGIILGVGIVWCSAGQYALANWWIENEVGKKEGKFYKGREGVDVTELGFWSSGAAQAYLGVASLCQLVVRGHSGGVSWGVWMTRTSGPILGLYPNYVCAWYFWREAYEYFMSPFGIFLWVTGLICDLIYPFFFYRIRKTEKVLPDGSKARGGRGKEGVGKSIGYHLL